MGAVQMREEGRKGGVTETTGFVVFAPRMRPVEIQTDSFVMASLLGGF